MALTKMLLFDLCFNDFPFRVISVRPAFSNEISALALVTANLDSSADTVDAHIVKQDMQKAGYTNLATQLALTRLSRMQFVEATEGTDYNGNVFVAYRMQEEGETWLLEKIKIN
jgi:hypothetical protein